MRDNDKTLHFKEGPYESFSASVSHFFDDDGSGL